MPAALYDEAPAEIRRDLVDAHQAIVDGWARAGNHWTGAERSAMVAEVRRARAADPLPAWVAPSTVNGLIGPTDLPEPAVDAVWRLTNHPGTLTEAWYRSIIERGITEVGYVELVGVVATANCLDAFARAIGVAAVPVPAPEPGEPDGRTGDGAVVSTHWVPTVPSRGPNVMKSLTAVPVAFSAWRTLGTAQYVPLEAVTGDMTWSRGPLERQQLELLAARTSLLHECFY